MEYFCIKKSIQREHYERKEVHCDFVVGTCYDGVPTDEGTGDGVDLAGLPDKGD